MIHPVVIIGAGLSGLSCARTLREAGVPVVILEKSRSFGGRCATRLWEGHVVDHGVLFFEESQTTFTAAARAVAAADLTDLTAPVVDASGAEIPSQGRRYTHRAGANRLAKALAEGIDLRHEHLVENLQALPEGAWQVGVANGTVVTASAVVLTAPGPQTATLLGTIGVDLPTPASDFSPCLTGFLAYEGEALGNTAEALARQGKGLLHWSVCENHKPGRIQPGYTVLVAHGSDDFSQEYFDAAVEVWLDLLRPEVEELWGVSQAAFLHLFGHRWRFARCWPGGWTSQLGLQLPAGIFLAGDTLVGSSVEAVWRSGRATALRLLDTMARPSQE